MNHAIIKVVAVVTGIWLVAAAVAADKKDEEKFRYLRIGKGKPITECTFVLERDGARFSISSVTGRGDASMTVTASYAAGDVLLSASAALTRGDLKQQALVGVQDGTARVKRPSQDAQEFAVPAGVIVTSAPDWTDTFLLCRRYDLKKGGKQEFAGLWIHPEQAAQRLTFTIEKQGSDSIDHDGQKMDLNRFLIRIRNNSPYAAWANDKGRMLKLVSLPFKEGGAELVLEGYEKSAAGLRPAKE